MTATLMYVLIALLLAVGLYGLVVKRHVLKKIIGLAIVEYAVNLFLVAIGYRAGGVPPILTDGSPGAVDAFAKAAVDPLPQALVLTSIVIGLGVMILLVALALRTEEQRGTLDTNSMNELRG